MREIGINSYSDVIIPKPLETIETYFDGMRKLSQANIDRVIPFTTMMLKGTEFASSANRKKFGMKTHKGKGKFFRSGKAEQWKDLLSLAQIKKIETSCKQGMKELNYL